MDVKKQGMGRGAKAPLAGSRAALMRSLLACAPGTVMDAKGYVPEPSQNLIEGVRLVDFEADLKQGDGNELAGKFRAAHSSSALAVNVFAPFKSDLRALSLPGGQNFDWLGFERKCPHGVSGHSPPNLDAVASGPEGVVAVESKSPLAASRRLRTAIGRLP